MSYINVDCGPSHDDSCPLVNFPGMCYVASDVRHIHHMVEVVRAFVDHVR